MEMGKKIRQARIEAKLSQRQLCGGEITRNMLSQIENGSAKPSMKTLTYLAGQLGKPVSYFLDETAVVSPNREVMAQARKHFDRGQFPEAVAALAGYREPDEVYDREKMLIWQWAHLEMAEEAIRQGKLPYGRELLEKVGQPGAYCAGELARRKLLLGAVCTGEAIDGRLPCLDRELTLRAEDCLKQGKTDRAGRLMDAAENRETAQWNLLRGRIRMKEGNFSGAVQCLHKAERAYPQETAGLLELCYRELEDYKMAYTYAVRQKIVRKE